MLDKLIAAPSGGSLAPSGRVRGRFAPSPSGRMHLGNVYAALMSRLSARWRGGQWLLRIEDIDRQRSRRQWAELIMSDLDWLGLGWDGEPVWQSERSAIYGDCLARLSAAGLVYPCSCTRAGLLAARAPHASDGHVAYTGRCRPAAPRLDAAGLDATLRLMAPPYPEWLAAPASGVVEFADRLCGPQRVVLADYCGDMVVRRRDGDWAYQFAVAIDDALMGVTEVVRGDDLLLSTAPQRYVASLLGLSAPTDYAHLPLLRNASGARLSKRDGALSMEWLRAHSTRRDVLAAVARAAAVDPDRLLALLDSI